MRQHDVRQCARSCPPLGHWPRMQRALKSPSGSCRGRVVYVVRNNYCVITPLRDGTDTPSCACTCTFFPCRYGSNGNSLLQLLYKKRERYTYKPRSVVTCRTCCILHSRKETSSWGRGQPYKLINLWTVLHPDAEL
eukprot:jgi/Botrbrau1/6811/Bobra.0153s0010.1